MHDTPKQRDIKDISYWLSLRQNLLHLVEIAQREMPSFFTETIFQIIKDDTTHSKIFQILGVLNRHLKKYEMVGVFSELGVPNDKFGYKYMYQK